MQLEFNNVAARPLVMAILGIESKCRVCGADLSPASAASFNQGKRVKCTAGCGWYGVWRDNTLLSGSRIDNLQFLIISSIAHCFKSLLPADEKNIAERINLTPATVRYWFDRIKSEVTA